jgi:uncharacterized RDD family membrane protein YckC
MSDDHSGDLSPGVDGGTPMPGREPLAAAALGSRIGARLLDVLIVGIPGALLLAVLGLRAAEGSVIVSLLWFGYFVWLESARGATVGKKLLNLRVVAIDGRTPDVATAAKRNLWMLFGLIPLIGDLLWLIAVIAIIVTISRSPDNRGYHDTFAGTRVVT